MPRAKNEICNDLKEMFARHYFPQITKEISEFSKRAFQEQLCALELSKICGKEISVNHGYLRIAKPTEDLIDKITDYVLEEKIK